MKNLVKHVQNMNALHHMWVDFDTIILGVSGGPDSMCLLDVMIKIAKKEQLTLIVAHINYGLRDNDSQRDQQLVESVAHEHGLPCETLIVDHMTQSNEELWRNIRYNYFEKLRIKYSAQCIMVAHNKNDQAETFLLHLLRGSGLGGLVGMRFVSPNYVIRPLLSVSRDIIITYCKKNNVMYNIDHTNSNPTFARNRIRTRLIPYLQKNYNPQIVSVLARTAEMIAEDIKALDTLVTVFWKTNQEKNTIRFETKDFTHINTALQRHCLMLMIRSLCGTTKNIEKGLIDELRKLILSTKNKNQTFSGKDLKMHRKGDTVIFTCCKS
ncbi:MAG: tRNA lysidine(34) synthetase TilS [Parcubacteria group bacterium]